MDVLTYLQKKAKTVDEEIDKLVPKNIEPEKLGKASRHLIEAGGKRLRPALTLTACEAVGGKSSNVVKSAAALEVLHTFTLVHDDIMDQDEFRRGVETVHEAWNLPMAINAGDVLFIKVYEALGDNAKSEGLSADKTIQLFDTVSQTSFKICQGQAMDMEFETRDKVTEPEYLEMVEKKTAALFEASTKIGALLGKGSQDEIDALAQYGKLMGIAFQIQDDLLGVAGEQEKVGKPVGSDVREGKWTILAVHSAQNASPEKRKFLLEILGKSDITEEEIEKAVEIFKETKSIEFAEKKSQELVNEAKSKLEGISDSEAKDFLIALADFSIEREI